MRHALVTGGTGRVGHFIVRALDEDGWRVTHLSRRAPAGAAHIPFGLDGPAPALPPADALVHAAFDHVPGRYRGGEGDDPDGFRRRNADASVALIAAAKAAGIPRALFLSSRAVLGGYPPGTRLTEDLPPRPDTLYGEVKAGVEAALAAMAGPGFAPAALRATGVYGPPPPGRTHKWAALFADYLTGRPVAPRVATEVHGDDLAAAALLLLNADPGLVAGKAFHVSDLLLDRHDLLAIVAEAMHARQPLPPHADASAVSVMDCARMRALGWAPGGVALLRRTVRALLSDA